MNYYSRNRKGVNSAQQNFPQTTSRTVQSAQAGTGPLYAGTGAYSGTGPSYGGTGVYGGTGAYTGTGAYGGTGAYAGTGVYGGTGSVSIGTGPRPAGTGPIPSVNVPRPTQKPSQPAARPPLFTPPAGQIQTIHSTGSLQTVQTTPAYGNEPPAPCVTCQNEDGSSLAETIFTAITDIAGGQIADVITVPKEITGGKTDAVTLPAAVWQIPTGATTGITTLPASVAELPTTGAVTLPAPAPDFKSCLSNFPLAICYVPMQKWETPYAENIGFEAGTIFPSLNLKFDAEKGCAVK